MMTRYGLLFVVSVVLLREGTNAKPPSRVVGGQDGDVGEFPYMAAIFKKTHHICGGAIISKRHILTAAHCFFGVSKKPWADMKIVTGTNVVSAGAGKSHVIDSVTIHPQYSDKSNDSWRNDIAVLSLKDEIGFDVFTQPISLPKADFLEPSKCVASGWGDMSYPKGIQPVNIRKAAMETMSNAQCETYSQRKYKILDSHLCAFEANGVGLCVGDSGGPLVYNGTTVVGVASFVLPCAKGVPDVFTRVYYYLDFIKKAMAES